MFQNIQLAKVRYIGSILVLRDSPKIVVAYVQPQDTTPSPEFIREPSDQAQRLAEMMMHKIGVPLNGEKSDISSTNKEKTYREVVRSLGAFRFLRRREAAVIDSYWTSLSAFQNDGSGSSSTGFRTRNICTQLFTSLHYYNVRRRR